MFGSTKLFRNCTRRAPTEGVLRPWAARFEFLENREMLTGNTLLDDTFDAENAGFAPHANYYTFANWNVTDGSVDLIDAASTAPGMPAANGLFVDLDGSTGNAGRLESKTLFSLIPGNYLLSFELAGPRSSTNAFGGPNPSDTVDVSLGSVYSERITKAYSEPFERIERHISVTAATNARLVFDHLGGDYVGLILDNVKLLRNQAPVAVDDAYSVNEDSSLVVPAAGTWETQPVVAAMPTPRVFPMAGVLDGRFYVFGGGSNAGPSAALEAYDPSTNSWIARATAPTARSSGAAGVIDNKLYVVGGCINSDCGGGTTGLLQVYDPVTNAWTTKAPMPTPRHSMTASTVDGKLYVVGGAPSTFAPYFATVEVYDPLTDTWESRTPLPTARSNLASAAIGGKLYVIGGAESGITGRLDVYDPVTNAWDTTNPPMPTARYYVQAAAVNGRLYVIGGHDGVAGLATNEVYDPTTNTWSTAASLVDDLHAFAVGIIESRLYAAGGYRSCDASCTTPNSLEIFTPVGDVLANDSDPDGDDMTAILVAGPANGTLNFSSDGSFSYAPNANFSGTDSFTYQAIDGIAPSNIATVTITVNPANDPPVAAGQSVSMAEDSTVAIPLAGSDVDGDAIAFAIVSQPAHGTLSGSAANPTYTPTANFNGADSFTFLVNDGASDSNVATVSINVTPVNDAPVVHAQSLMTAEETSLSLTLTATDVDSAVHFHVLSLPAHGKLIEASGLFSWPIGHVFTAAAVVAGPSFIYQPDPNFHGTDSFHFQASDGFLLSPVETISITVLPVNDPPAADSQSVSVTEDGVVSIVLSGSDVETLSESLFFRLTSLPSYGVLRTADGSVVRVDDAFEGPPTLVYEPGAACAACASDGSFTFTITDSGDGSAAPLTSAPATVSISIQPAVADGAVTVDADGIVRIGGTEVDDMIVVTHGSGLRVSINGVAVGDDIPLASVSEIRVWGREGNDHIEVIDLAISAMIHGGAGDDELIGSTGHDLIFGGAGNDTLTGASGNDFLIGSDGADRVIGSAGHDILVAAEVANSFTRDRLREVSLDWVADRAVDPETVDEVLDETLVDNAFDMLTGSSGSDWFIIGVGDKITDFKKQNADGDLVTIA